MTHAPDTVHGPLVLPSPVLEDARRFFEDRGTFGLEGTAMIKAGGGEVELVVPTQHARRDLHGHVNVEVPRAGQMELARTLTADEVYVARIHSHRAEAFHSHADDVNPVITFEGALSVVVPFFGLGLRRGLEACAVYRHHDGRWVELPAGEDRDQWIISEAKP